MPFLYGGAVTQHHWLTEKRFVDAVAVAMITPAPVVIAVGFIGYLVAGVAGATVAALATFIPCYLFTIIPAPYFKRYGKLPSVVAFVNGISAAAIGANTGSLVVLARRSLVDIPTVLVAVVAGGSPVAVALQAAAGAGRQRRRRRRADPLPAHAFVRRSLMSKIAVLSAALVLVAPAVLAQPAAFDQPVLKSLRGAGIYIVAIHQHMTGEQPRLMFLHYWGQGKARELAKSVRAAINLTTTSIDNDSTRQP